MSRDVNKFTNGQNQEYMLLEQPPTRTTIFPQNLHPTGEFNYHFDITKPIYEQTNWQFYSLYFPYSSPVNYTQNATAYPINLAPPTAEAEAKRSERDQSHARAKRKKIEHPIPHSKKETSSNTKAPEKKPTNIQNEQKSDDISDIDLDASSYLPNRSWTYDMDASMTDFSYSKAENAKQITTQSYRNSNEQSGGLTYESLEMTRKYYKQLNKHTPESKKWADNVIKDMTRGM